MAPDIKLALKSLRIERWVYLLSTTRYAVFLDLAVKNAFAARAQTNPIETMIGVAAFVFETGLFSFTGRWVCDGLIQNPVRLGCGYVAEVNAALAVLRNWTVPSSPVAFMLPCARYQVAGHGGGICA